jgi:HEAT repeat protein
LVRLSAILALGSRGDASAIPALEALLKSEDLSIEMAPMVKGQIERLKNPRAKVRHYGPMGEEEGGSDGEEASAPPTDDQRLSHIEQLVEAMNDRLKSIETRLPPPPPNK